MTSRSKSAAPALFGPSFGMGLYVHWPYCARICPYCDFNVFAAKGRDPDPLIEAMLADISGHSRLPGYRPMPLTSVFFGGGTPSLMPPEAIWSILGVCHQTFGLADGCEVSLEANPNDITTETVSAWRDMGVNRLSIGVQSLDDAALTFLGRDHDAHGARRAVSLALERFPSVSIDLIYARPGQSTSDWETELGSALKLGAPHLALYELTIEEKTAFGARARRGDLVPMSDDEQADLYDLTQTVCDAAGLPAYEVSNHAAGTEHRARHNLTYWRGGDWIGIGPGAHGRLSVKGQRIATEAARKPDAYINRVQHKGRGWQEKAVLTPRDTARELVAMGLRPSEGLDRRAIEALAGQQMDMEKIAAFEAAGYLTQAGDRLALTAQGRLLADRIAVELSP